MVQVIETEPLRYCPFCDGEPELRVAEHPIDENRKVAKVVCLQCNACTSGFSTGKDFFTGKETTLDEAIKKAARAWNCRPEMETREQEREAYIKALPQIKISAMLEAVKLSDYAEAQEKAFCNDMARLYGCRPLNSGGGI
ncbi:Lar family restriction alleviation protein [Enterocloster clostridioformis]|uniref:Lar family restriction alleviation protein n=1 Tax=Enterocloster clostridioformis TaxID=1531 RepID=UPI002674BF90|nr:Lar family restriction alleviation protein [Enterocloster clostridioformis]